MVSSTNRTSRVAVFRGVGEPLQLERFPLPEPQGSEVLARVRCATICGSDLHSYYGRRPAPVPGVLGHEMVAEIERIGPKGAQDLRGQPLRAGDRVTWSMVWSCGTCFYCQHDLRPKCERLMKFGHEPLTPGREFIGGLAEHCLLPEGTAIVRVPHRVTDTVASPSNCATATVMAVFRAAGEAAHQTVVVHGAGMLGLTACAVAATRGAKQVVVIEPDPRRCHQARQFGATATLDGGESAAEIRARILDMSAGRGADLGLEFCGRPEAFALGLELLRPGGRFVLAGATFPSQPVHVAAEQLVRRLLHLVGVYNYQPEDLETALTFLDETHDRFPFETLVPRAFPLHEINQAFHCAEHERPPRVAVRP